MYCVVVNNFRKTLLNGVHLPIDGNYYTPEENCVASMGGKNLCGICGEKAKWKRGNSLKTHSTKCCPYRHHFLIQNRKEFVDALEEGLRFQREERNLLMLNQSIRYDELYKEKIDRDNLLLIMTAQLEETKKTRATLLEIFGEDEIQKRADLLFLKNERLKELSIHIATLAEKEKKQTLENQYSKMLWELSKKKVGNLEKSLEVLRLSSIAVIENYHNQLEENDKMSEENKKLWSALTYGAGNKKIENCPICLEVVIENATTTECGHSFHSSCYTTFLVEGYKNHQHKTIDRTIKCPLCRFPLFTLGPNDD